MALSLYHVTVQRPDAITASEVCFFGSNQEHLVLARGQWLEVLKIEDDELVLKCRSNVFATIRCINRIRTPGSPSDTLALTSDSGDIVVLAYDCEHARFSKVASEPMGRSGFRRTTPGEYLSVDPKGRALMTAGIEKLRTVYILHSDGISSPIEAHAGSTFCYGLVAMDRGYGNPAFASLERFRFGQKAVVMYELNLGLNHLVKVWSHIVTDDTDVIIPIPGGRDGPSGVIAVSGSTAIYLDPVNGEDKFTTSLPLPVICSTTVRVKRGEFFVIVQTVDGSCFKLNLNDDSLTCTRMGSLPRALELHATKSGHIFVNSEVGDHILTSISSLDPPVLGELTHLPSISPCISSSLQRKQLILINGDEGKSRVSNLEYGLEIEELVSSSLPGVPSAVYAAKRTVADTGYGLIALSFEKTTTFLAVADDGSVNEISEAESRLATQVHTLGLQLIGDALVQVHPSGFRHVSGQAIPWVPPKGLKVTGCAFTPSQMLLMLSGKQVVYFEARDGTLVESKQKIELPSTPTAVCFASPPAQELRSETFYISCDDETVRMFSVVDLKQQRVLKAAAPVVSIQYLKTLHVGHSNGMYSQLHNNSFWTRVLGKDPVKLVCLPNDKLVALTSRTWVVSETDVLLLKPPSFIAAHPFITEDLPDGVLGIVDSSLVVFTVPSRGIGLKTSVRSLNFPSSLSRLARNPTLGFSYACGSESIFVIENNANYPQSTSFSTQIDSPCIACSNVRFDTQKKEFLIVASRSSIDTYEYTGLPLGSEIQLLHRTPVDHCSAILPFRNMLLAAINKNRLVLYDLGRKQLLRKAVIDLPDLAMIKLLRASRDRIYVGDSRQSVTVISYTNFEFSVAYSDPIPRSVTAMVLLDHATVCIGDQYGNIAVLRCPGDQIPETISPGENQLELLAHFRISDGIVDLHKGMLSPVAGIEAIIYTGIQGTIGSLIPFASNEDRTFFEELQSEVNRRVVGLAGHDNLALRCYYTPLKNVVDGDLCEFALCRTQGLDGSEVDEIAAILDSDCDELVRRVFTFRDRSVF